MAWKIRPSMDESGREKARIGEAVLTAADNAGVAIIVTRVAPVLENLYVSPYAAELLGVPIEQALSANPFSMLAPGEQQKLLPMLERRRQGGSPPAAVRTRLRLPGGTEIPIEVGLAPIDLDGQPGTVSFLRDLREPEAAQEKLERSEARFRSLIESAPDAIVMSRARGIVYANPAAASLLGFDDPEALRGRSFADILHPDDFVTMGERIARLRVGGPPLGPFEYRARARGGEAVVVEVTSILVDLGDGPAVLGFARDVTESRRLQAQLVRADRLAALGTLVAGMAHEINNPLAFMMLGVDTLERQLGREEAAIDSMRATLGDIRHGIERIAGIVRDLRAFSRSEEGPRRSVADLRAALDAAARMVEHEVRQHGRLVTRYAELPSVRADGSQLEQVFLNLLLNAAQALDRSRSGTIEIDARPDGDRVVVTVTDNGVGIPSDQLGRVFDPFFTTKPVGAGTGLGLSIVHTLVSELGGEVGIESEVGEGTTVTVTLPVSRRTPASTPARPFRRKGDKSARVLVVDDEQIFLRAIETLLVAEGHSVATAGGAEEAMRAIESVEHDLILLDLMMPGVSGIELFHRIGVDRPELARRIVVMTGGTSSEEVRRFVSSTKSPVLRKPFPIAKLLALLGRVG